MLPVKTWAGVVSLKSSFSMPQSILVIPFLMSLAGCSNEGAGGPMISSLSTPTDAREELDSDPGSNSAATNSGRDGEEDPMITMTSTPTGVTAHVTWVHPPDMNVAGYNIYYRKQPSAEPSSEEPTSEESGSEEPSSCSSGESQAVEGPAATITGLEPNTRYLFAIRAFNESESLCSNEITAVTPPAES